jgi:hypothetical protein
VAALGVFVGDRIALQHTESGISSRIEARVPGSHATVTISSSPFLVHLAASGTVQELRAHVTGVTDGGLRLDSVDVTIRNLKISRTSLTHGSVRLLSLSSATITATVSVAEMLRAAGYSLQAGFGALTSGATASLKAGSGRVQITFGSLTFSFPYGSLVPCVGSARVSGAEVILTCTTTTLPPALQTA